MFGKTAKFHNMDIRPALYQQMRFNILSTTFNGMENCPFPSHYIYGWAWGVYPFWSHDEDIIEFHQPHNGQFRVNADDFNWIRMHLDREWADGKRLSFSDLEEHFKDRAYEHGPFSRYQLAVACRYHFLAGVWSRESAWNDLKDASDVRLYRICSDFKLDEDVPFANTRELVV